MTISSAAPANGLTIDLKANSKDLDVPPTVVVSAGSRSATFTATAVAVASLTTIRVTATANGTTETGILKVDPPTLTTLSFNPNKVAGGLVAVGTVGLNRVAPSGGLKVTLSCKETGLTLPKSVTIPAGTQSANFNIPTASTSNIISAQIVATLHTTTLRETLTIDHDVLEYVTVGDLTVVGGSVITGTVNSNGPAPAGGLVIDLSSDNPSATVPTSVKIPAGATYAPYAITTKPVATLTVANVTISYKNGYVPLPVNIEPPALSGISINPATVSGGGAATGTVTLDGPAPSGGFLIALSSDQKAVATPSSVTVPEGSQTGTFTISTTSVQSTMTATITATDPSKVTATAKLTISAGTGLANGIWPKFRGDAANTGQGTGMGSDGTVIWSTQITSNTTWSSPAIGPDGTLYVSCGEQDLHAVSSSGTVKWTFATGALIMASPAIGYDGTVYVGSEDGVFYAINPDGTLKWKYQTGNQIQSSPSIAPDGTIYCGSYDGFLYAFNPDGSKKWAYNTGGAVFPSPALGQDGTIYLGAAGLFAINPDGTQKWFFSGDGNDFQSASVGSDGTIYVFSNGGKLYAVNPDGSQKWVNSSVSGSLGLVVSSPAIGLDGTIFIGSFDHNLYAINPDGSKKWSYSTGDYIQSSPAVGPDGVVYFSSNDGNIYALKSDGTVKWTNPHGGLPSSPALGSDGTVYFCSPDGSLYAVGKAGPTPLPVKPAKR